MKLLAGAGMNLAKTVEMDLRVDQVE